CSSDLAGRPLDPALAEENLDALRRGAGNLVKHIENMGKFGVPAVVAINRFGTDTDAEVALVREIAEEAGATAAVSDVYARGGAGGEELAEKVIEAANRPSHFRFLYELDATIRDKIETVAQEIYGAEGVTYEPRAQRDMAWLTEHGFDRLPICMAKTQY